MGRQRELRPVETEEGDEGAQRPAREAEAASEASRPCVALELLEDVAGGPLYFGQTPLSS